MLWLSAVILIILLFTLWRDRAVIAIVFVLSCAHKQDRRLFTHDCLCAKVTFKSVYPEIKTPCRQ